MSLFLSPTRLLRGRTQGYPERCSQPTCRAAVVQSWALYVRQGPRNWAFCSVECAVGFIRLSGLVEVHADEMAELANDTGWLE